MFKRQPEGVPAGMDWEISYWPDEQIVYVQTRGTMHLNQLKQMAADALAEAERRSSAKILADHRATTHAIAVVDIYHLPVALRELGLSATHSVATVFSPEAGQKFDFTFFDNRASNTGLRHALFTDVDAAKQWLVAQGSR
jgi:hypothetical protein